MFPPISMHDGRTWTTLIDGSRYLQILSTPFAMQGSASLRDFHHDSRCGDQFPAGSYLVQGPCDPYAAALHEADFMAWLGDRK